MKQRQIKGVKLLCIILLVCLTAASRLVGPTQGYEVSIYDALPAAYWLLFVAALSIGAFLIASTVFWEFKDGWKYGIMITLLTAGTLLATPILRGYWLYGVADVLTHYARIATILDTGSPDPTNMYPMTHLLAATIIQFTGLPISVVMNALPIFFVSLYITSTLLFARYFGRERQEAWFLVALLVIPHYYWIQSNPIPFATSFFIFPLFFALYLKTKKSNPPKRKSWITSFVVTGVAFTLYHPMTSLITLIIFVVYWAIKWGMEAEDRNRLQVRPSTIALVTSIGGVWMIWYFFRGMVDARIAVNLRWILMGGGPSEVQEQGSVMAEAPYSIQELALVAFYRIPSVFIVAVFAGIAVCYILYSRVNYKQPLQPESLFLAAAGIITALLSVAVHFTDVSRFEREGKFAVFLGAALTAIGMHRLRENRGRNRYDAMQLTTVVLVVFLVVASVAAVGSVFRDPHMKYENNQHLEQNAAGIKWLSHTTGPVSTTKLPPHSYEQTVQRDVHPEISVDYVGRPPERFGRDEPPLQDDQGNSIEYILTHPRWRRSGQAVHPDYPSYWRYTNDDFSSLHAGGSFNKVYTTGETRIYKASDRLDRAP